MEGNLVGGGLEVMDWDEWSLGMLGVNCGREKECRVCGGWGDIQAGY